jgi:hypothetical protein
MSDPHLKKTGRRKSRFAQIVRERSLFHLQLEGINNSTSLYFSNPLDVYHREQCQVAVLLAIDNYSRSFPLA